MDNENKDIMEPDESSDNNKPDNSKIQKKKNITFMQKNYIKLLIASCLISNGAILK